MVTVITDKLRQQTLEDITSTAQRIQSRNLRKASQQLERESSIDLAVVRKPKVAATQVIHGHNYKHRRSRSRGQQLEQSVIASHTSGRRCNSYPPAKKRICRSHSDPYNNRASELEAFSWTPEPSSIWTPVKQQQTSDRATTSAIIRPNAGAIARSLEFTNKEIFSWSTPPESPVPRPVSANSVLQDSTFSPLRLISEERDEIASHSGSLARGCCPSARQCASLPRSHSHPCFSNIPANNGLKRRLSEVDIPRPALDFDKMKARAFVNPNLQKRTVKYSSKRHSSTSPKISHSSKSDKLSLAVDLSSSLLITPTASPTNSEEVKTIYEQHMNIHDENSNTSHASFSEQECFGCAAPTIETDLDINLIEEDGTR